MCILATLIPPMKIQIIMPVFSFITILNWRKSLLLNKIPLILTLLNILLSPQNLSNHNISSLPTSYIDPFHPSAFWSSDTIFCLLPLYQSFHITPYNICIYSPIPFYMPLHSSFSLMIPWCDLKYHSLHKPINLSCIDPQFKRTYPYSVQKFLHCTNVNNTIHCHKAKSPPPHLSVFAAINTSPTSPHRLNIFRIAFVSKFSGKLVKKKD